MEIQDQYLKELRDLSEVGFNLNTFSFGCGGLELFIMTLEKLNFFK